MVWYVCLCVWGGGIGGQSDMHTCWLGHNQPVIESLLDPLRHAQKERVVTSSVVQIQHRQAPHDPIRLNVVADRLGVVVGPSKHVKVAERNKRRCLRNVSVSEKRNAVTTVLELRAKVAPRRVDSLAHLRHTSRS